MITDTDFSTAPDGIVYGTLKLSDENVVKDLIYSSDIGGFMPSVGQYVKVRVTQASVPKIIEIEECDEPTEDPNLKTISGEIVDVDLSEGPRGPFGTVRVALQNTTVELLYSSSAEGIQPAMGKQVRVSFLDGKIPKIVEISDYDESSIEGEDQFYSGPASVTQKTVKRANWPIACMGCGVPDKDLLTQRRYTWKREIDPLGGSTWMEAGIIPRMSDRAKVGTAMNPVTGLLTLAADLYLKLKVRSEEKETPLFHFKLHFKMYVCPSCNRDKPDYTRFLTIGLKPDTEREQFLYSLKFTSKDFERRFNRENPNQILAKYELKER
jgi:hypothetical protein